MDLRGGDYEESRFLGGEDEPHAEHIGQAVKVDSRTGDSYRGIYRGVERITGDLVLQPTHVMTLFPTDEGPTPVYSWDDRPTRIPVIGAAVGPVNKEHLDFLAGKGRIILP